MTRLWPITAGFGVAAAAVPWLPGLAPIGAWSVLAASYAGVVGYGSGSVRSQLFGTALCSLPATNDAVALTFDDGPDAASTPRLLDVLRAHGARATFFCVGERVRAEPALVRRIHDDGHEIGNHGDRHLWTAPFRLGTRLANDLLGCQRAIEAATGQAPRWYRPPYGVRNHATHGVCARLGLQVVGWSVRGLDMPNAESEAVATRVLRRLAGGDIVLLHDGGRKAERVAEIAERILVGMAARGLRAVDLAGA